MHFTDLLNYAINTAVFFAGLLLLYFLVQKIRKVHPGKKRQLQNAASLLYFAFLAGLLLVPPWNFSPFYFVTGAGEMFEALNLVPFRTLGRQLGELFRGENALNNLCNLLVNVALFVPFPLCLRCLFRRMPKGLCLFLPVLFSALVEVVQYFTGGRIADVDDFLLNTLGTVIGFALLSCERFFIKEK